MKLMNSASKVRSAYRRSTASPAVRVTRSPWPASSPRWGFRRFLDSSRVPRYVHGHVIDLREMSDEIQSDRDYPCNDHAA